MGSYYPHDNSYSQHTYQRTSSTAYGGSDQFSSHDLGTDEDCTELMFRSGSRKSNASYSTHDTLLDGNFGNFGNTQFSQPSDINNLDAALVDYASPGLYSESTFYDFQIQPASNTPVPLTPVPYTPCTPRYETINAATYPHMMALDSLPMYSTSSSTTMMSPIYNPLQPHPNQNMSLNCAPSALAPHRSAVQSPKATWSCPEHCGVKPFARNADLRRHMAHKHTAPGALEKWFCDRKNCLRSEEGYHKMLERRGGLSPYSPHDCSSGKDNGTGPFLRKDHFKAHLRDIHKEPLPKRSAREDPNWGEGKTFQPDWWRCHKCLQRVYRHKDGFACSGEKCGFQLTKAEAAQVDRKMNEARMAKKRGEGRGHRFGTAD